MKQEKLIWTAEEIRDKTYGNINFLDEQFIHKDTLLSFLGLTKGDDGK